MAMTAHKLAKKNGRREASWSKQSRQPPHWGAAVQPLATHDPHEARGVADAGVDVGGLSIESNRQRFQNTLDQFQGRRIIGQVDGV